MADLRWVLEEKEQPWGDYGYILAYGMTEHLGRSADGLLQLERTGPWCPGMFLSGVGDLLLRETHRHHLKEAGLVGLDFRPVELARIVRLDWHDWDPDADDPVEYPESGSPEGYILERAHDPDLAADLGPVWEVVIGSPEDEPGADLARPWAESARIGATDRAADLIRQIASESIHLKPSETD